MRTLTGVTVGSALPFLFLLGLELELEVARKLRAVLAAVGAVSLDSLLDARLLGCGAALGAAVAATALVRGFGFSCVLRHCAPLMRTRLQRCAKSSV